MDGLQLPREDRERSVEITAPAMTVEQQVAQIRMKLAEHTIGSDNNTHRVNNPIWEEEKP
jgi:hypothetical protein